MTRPFKEISMPRVIQKLLLKRLEEEDYQLNQMEYARPTMKLIFIPAIGDWVVRIYYHIYDVKKSRILKDEELFLFLSGAISLQDL